MWEINQKIAAVKGAAPTMDDMPPEDAPEVGVVYWLAGVLVVRGTRCETAGGWIVSCGCPVHCAAVCALRLGCAGCINNCADMCCLLFFCRCTMTPTQRKVR